MSDFWSLPRDVRDKIYRLHLIQDEPIDDDTHDLLTQRDPRGHRGYNRKRMPTICFVSDYAEKEAAAIYYGESHFVFGRMKSGAESSVFRFTDQTWPRHLRLIRQVTCQWPIPYSWSGPGYGMAGEFFNEIARFKGLRELNIRADEDAMIRRMLVPRRRVQCSPQRPMTLQDGVALLRHPGMSSLLKISDVPSVNFLKAFGYRNVEKGGSITGGYLETVVRPRLQGVKERTTTSRVKGAFDFLSLPPELRNGIYALLLKFDGPIHPSTKPPTSASKGKTRAASRDHGSGLNILGTSRQVYDEAYGIFYDSNTFEFYYPIQLHAFVLSLGQERLGMIKDITVQYHNISSGGVDLAGISLPMLKQLTGLRRLQIQFVLGGLKNRTRNRGWWHTPRPSLKNANPLALPGMKSLFDLRGIEEITVRDVDLEEDLETIKKDKRYPDGFGVVSREQVYLDLERVLDHLNAALAQAQVGKINFEMLEDDKWHMRDEFPEIVGELADLEDEGTESGEPELDSAGAMDVDGGEEQPETRLDGVSDRQDAEITTENTNTLRSRRYNLRSSTWRDDQEADTGSSGALELSQAESDEEIVAGPRRSARLKENAVSIQKAGINNATVFASDEEDDDETVANRESDKGNLPREDRTKSAIGQAEASAVDDEGDEIIVSHARNPKATTSGVAPMSDFAKLMAAFECRSANDAAVGDACGEGDEMDDAEDGKEEDVEQSYWAREPSAEL